MLSSEQKGQHCELQCHGINDILDSAFEYDLLMQAARPALQRVKAGQSFLKVVGASSAAPGISL